MTSCSRYTEEFISRFVDNQVSCPDQDNFVRHMDSCPACAKTLAEFSQVNHAFERHVATQANRIRPISLEKKPAARSRGIVLKLAAMGTAGLIFAVALLPWAGDRISEPSAIVNSVDTYGSSVMIIDTQDNRHTIIWFSET